jgi:hypothetical protein
MISNVLHKKMKKKTYIILSAASFLLAFPIAHVILKPLANWLVPDGVQVVALSITDPLHVTMLFSATLAITLALLPLSALILQNRWRFFVVLAATILLGIVATLAMRANIHVRMGMASQLIATDSHMLSWREIHLERIPLASLLAVVVSTLIVKLKRKRMENNELESIVA